LVDGEMPRELIRQRAIDALRRAGIAPEPGKLLIYARDMEEQFAERCRHSTLSPGDNGCLRWSAPSAASTW
jgi:hypothetical protein